MGDKEIDANYGLSEDVAASISVKETSTDSNAVRPKSFQLHGPKCIGCQDYDKAVMLSYTEDGDRTIYDLYLNATNAKKFLADIEQFCSPGNPLVIAFQNTIDGKSKKFLIDGDHLDSLIKRLDWYRDDINSYIESNKAFADEEPIPARRPPLTEAEKEAARKFLDNHYKPEPRDVSLDGINMGLLLAALYNNAKTGGAGIGHSRDELMTPDEGQHILSELSRIGSLPEIDYINGRSIKCYFGQDERGRNTLRTTRYWDYNDIPSAAIISLARKGVYGTLPSQGGLDVKNEAAIVSRMLSGKSDKPTVDADHLAKALEQQQAFYLEAQRPADEPVFYQIRIAGNGSIRGEVGHLIVPFIQDQIPPAATPFVPC